MEICKLDKIDLINLAKEKGYVYGRVLMNSTGFFKLCYMHGFKPSEFRRFFSPTEYEQFFC